MKQLTAAINTALSFLPSKLPVGLTEFNTWADSIISLSGNYADQDSMRFAIASMVIHLPAGRASVSKRYFVNSLRKSAANQVASQVFQDVKTKQAEVLAKLKQAEETAKTETSTSGQETTN